jgi:hypothetical protein
LDDIDATGSPGASSVSRGVSVMMVVTGGEKRWSGDGRGVVMIRSMVRTA